MTRSFIRVSQLSGQAYLKSRSSKIFLYPCDKNEISKNIKILFLCTFPFLTSCFLSPSSSTLPVTIHLPLPHFLLPSTFICLDAFCPHSPAPHANSRANVAASCVGDRGRSTGPEGLDPHTTCFVHFHFPLSLSPALVLLSISSVFPLSFSCFLNCSIIFIFFFFQIILRYSGLGFTNYLRTT